MAVIRENIIMASAQPSLLFNAHVTMETNRYILEYLIIMLIICLKCKMDIVNDMIDDLGLYLQKTYFKYMQLG